VKIPVAAQPKQKQSRDTITVTNVFAKMFARFKS